MKARTERALRSSIAHWRRLANGKRKAGETLGVNSCALCVRFFHETNRSSQCEGCPISQATGLPVCRGTPYMSASDKLHRAGGADPDIQYLDPEFLKAARKEYDFLVSLLPEKKPK